MPAQQSNYWTAITTSILQRMGFNIAHLQFYRWLVEQGRDPEFGRDRSGGSALTPVAVPAGR